MTSGAEGDRTPDLRAASAALSQLSYGPKDSPEYRHANYGCQRVLWYPPRTNLRTPNVALLVLPVLLGGGAPQGFEAVVVAGLVGEDVNDDVEKV